MFTGFIRQWDSQKFCFPKAFDTAIAFLSRPDILSMEPGRHPTDGDMIFAMVVGKLFGGVTAVTLAYFMAPTADPAEMAVRAAKHSAAASFSPFC